MDLGVPGTITAVLGPTNTGKTHVAVQRMLGHRTGMIGLPLRLLAREVYDRVVQLKGSDQVALVTGEEKIVPVGTKYWVCTVESMPVDRPVAFVAVDEIQLAADPSRGHVFTDRLLRCRGVVETWFLGSDTIAPLLQQLVPTAQIRAQPRLSRLSWAGTRKLVSLPPRSAVVAFSVQRVYELAERLRARHGGAAVVTGALSPRARNAQVDLFQSGDVAHIVATDAIGMGLNMDVHHVALAGTDKFDGRTVRALRADELAQIAGRAGRWKRDGTFGVTAGIDALDPEVIDAIEQHTFPRLRRLWWRNAELSFDDVHALQDSLAAPPPRRCLVPTRDADDARVLEVALRDAEVSQRATDPARVRLLWDACGVPDFGNVLPEHHATLVAQLYAQLVDHDGCVPDAWLERQVVRVERTDGDLGTLTARLAAVRTWTYVANRPGWVADPAAWQARTRALEDQLSDALHERLTARFVDRHARAFARLDADGEALPVLRPSGEVTLADRRLGVLRGLTFELDPAAQASSAVLAAVRQRVAPLLQARLDALVDAPDGAFGVDPTGGVRWDGAPVAQLLRGDDWRRPRLRLRRLDWLEGAARGQVAARVERWLRSWLADGVRELVAPDHAGPGARAVLYALTAGWGAVPRALLRDTIATLTPDDRAVLRAAGVVPGRLWVLHPAVVRRTEARMTLWAVHHGQDVRLDEDTDRPVRAPWSAETAEALGHARLAGHVVRVDALEAMIAQGIGAARREGWPAEVLARIDALLASTPSGHASASGRAHRRRRRR
ncbi:MAG: disulfide oxidoreductase [Alphaproteobacteria bacterium]|nr:disulfide oxidoreductase [Alphaproteobacteria bacterium]